MKRSPAVVLCILVLFVAAPAAALDSGIENLRQTSKAFATVAREVTPSVALSGNSFRFVISIFLAQGSAACFGHALDDFPFRFDQVNDPIQCLVIAVFRICLRL